MSEGDDDSSIFLGQTTVLDSPSCCCLCLETKTILNQQTGSEKNDSVRRILVFLQIQLNFIEDIPLKICQNCLGNLESFVLFYTKIHQIHSGHNEIRAEDNHCISSPSNINCESSQKEVDGSGNLKEPLNIISFTFDELESSRVLRIIEPNDRSGRDLLLKSSENRSTITVDDVTEIQTGQEKIASRKIKPKSQLNLTVTQKRRRSRRIKTESIGRVKLMKIEDKDISSLMENSSPDENSEDDSRNLSKVGQRRILENGLLLVKGKKLEKLIRQFYKLECEICTKSKAVKFKSLKDTLNHYKTEHQIPGYVSCCNLKLTGSSVIIMHMASHIQPDAFQCDICGYIVSRPRFLESHKQTHLPDNEKPFACNQCPRRFCWKPALQIHQITHLPKDQRKIYSCNVCNKSYDTPGVLSNHKRCHILDRSPESNVCDVCAKSFASRTGLKEHMVSLHQPREKAQIQCPKCDKWLMNKRCFKSHMILHSDVVLKCQDCDYTTKKRVLLQRHQATQHSDAKPFNCRQCGRGFKLKRSMVVHETQHTNPGSFKCNFCDRVFANASNYYTHRKNVHPAELKIMKEKELEEKRKKRIQAGIEGSFKE